MDNHVLVDLFPRDLYYHHHMIDPIIIISTNQNAAYHMEGHGSHVTEKYHINKRICPIPPVK